MKKEKRKSVETLIRELHQRQSEVVIPRLEELYKDVKGNGKKGLLDRVTSLESSFKLLLWGIPLLITVFGLLRKFGVI